MMVRLAFLLLVLCGAGAEARSKTPPIGNPALLNIGFVCQWQEKCIKRQERAMKRALKYVKKYRPPSWKIEQCNRNAARGRHRVDWLGFDNCIRNPALRPQLRRSARRAR